MLGKQTDVVTMEQGQRTLAVVEAALESARSHASVELTAFTAP